MKKIPKYAIIVAGGKGLRMNSEMPKQFLCVQGVPVLMHSIQAFYEYDSKVSILVVLPQLHSETWARLCEQYNFRIPHRVVYGGSERFFSVQNGLNFVSNDSVVAVHDGVRPCVTRELLERGYGMAVDFGGVVPIVDSVDSLRMCKGESFTPIDRTLVKRVQTPQFFQARLLRDSYKQKFSDAFTDDASVYERAGNLLYVCEGDQYNIKITHPCDIAIAEAILQYQNR
ncbi:MAG: 2-C-methyl-D-erythritol 4-phosphate cytidylyltransferase [Bacteroidales bacterium]